MTTRIAICFLALWAVAPTHLVAQASDCNDPAASPEANAMAQQSWESRSSPVYEDASNLARDLAMRGITVECIRRPKLEHLFAGQKGAAWFKTNQGIFEVWFMPDAAAAEEAIAKVTARPAPVSLPSGQNQIFVPYRNLVFWVNANRDANIQQRLAASLQRVFQTP